MKVLVIGAKQFVGKNLLVRLNNDEKTDIVTYDFDDNSKIENKIENVDFIYHLMDDYEKEGTRSLTFTKRLLSLINDKKIPLVMPVIKNSNITTTYKKNKAICEKLVLMYSKHAPVCFAITEELFGKWADDNNLVKKICNDIDANKDLELKNEKLSLSYIDDYTSLLYQLLKKDKIDLYVKNNIVYNICSDDLINDLLTFKQTTNEIMVPQTGNEFIKKLYSTYISYKPLDELACNIISHSDQRGNFTECIKTTEAGQVSISVSKPGIIRGNDYHNTQMEKLVIITGKAKIILTDIFDNSTYDYYLDDSNKKIITLPVGYKHTIENIGDQDMIILHWRNDLFDKNKSQDDVYTKSIKINDEDYKRNK